MKSQPKSPLTQLNLPLLDLAPIALPAGKDQQRVQALIERLLHAAGAATVAEGGNHEPQADR